jgi:hypothetical protein
MQDNSATFADRIAPYALVLAAILYLGICLFFIGSYQHQIYPDGVSYVSIAKKYFVGDYAHAVNGLWSPLIIWLLVPFYYLHIEPTLGFKILEMVTGLFALYGIKLLFEDVGISNNLKLLYLLALCPTLTFFAFIDQTPDFLGMCLVVYWIHFLTHDNYRKNRYLGGVVGLLGGLSYLAKAYNFYFFICFFLLLNGIFLLVHRESRKTVVTNLLIGAVIFSVISGFWIGVLSHKYGKFTISTTGPYTLSMAGPKLAGTEIFPMYYEGFMKPTNATAVSTWEDPSFQKMPPWNPLGSLADTKYLLNRVFVAAYTYVYDLSKNPVFAFTLLYVLIAALTTRTIETDKIYYYGVAILCYPIGYFVTHVEDRYLWINKVLITVLSAYVMLSIFKKVKLGSLQKRLIMVFVFSYIFLIPLNALFGNQNNGTAVYQISRVIKADYQMQGKHIASQYGVNQALDWNQFLSLCYFLDAKYYGITNKDTTDQILRNQLNEFDIDYYFVRGRLRNSLDILKFDRKVGDVSIYKVEKSAKSNSSG